MKTKLKRFNRTARYWEKVRDEIAFQAAQWSKGSEAADLRYWFTEDPDWQDNCQGYAVKDRTFGPRDLAHRIVYNYLSQI